MPRLKNTVHEKFAQLLALKHLSQHAAWLEAIGPQRAAKVLAKNKRATSLISAASKLAAIPSIRPRVEEIQAENDPQRQRIGRRGGWPAPPWCAATWASDCGLGSGSPKYKLRYVPSTNTCARMPCDVATVGPAGL
jgi:hypothetical protein